MSGPPLLAKSLSQLVKTENGLFSKNNKLYYLKNASSEEANHEAYCASLVQFIATKEYVPNYRAYIPNAVAAKHIPFTPHCDDPLQEQDLDIGYSAFQLPYLVSLLHYEINQIKKHLQKEIKKAGIAIQICSLIPFFSFNANISTIHFCNSALDALADLDHKSMQNLQADARCPENIKTLLEQYFYYYNKPGQPVLSITEFDKIAMQRVPGNDQDISQQAIEKYRLLKGLGRSLIARAIFEEADLNNTNFSKTGIQLDFGYSKPWVYLANYYDNPKKAKLLLQHLGLLSKPMSHQDIESFPELSEDNSVHYWPTLEKEYNYLYIKDKIVRIIIEFRDNEEENTIQYELAEIITKLCIKLNEIIHPELAKPTSDPQSIISNLIAQIYISFKSYATNIPPVKLMKQEEKKIIFDNLLQTCSEFCEKHKDIINKCLIAIKNNSQTNKRLFTKQDNIIYKHLSYHPVFIYHKNISLLKYLLTFEAHYLALSKLYLSENKRKLLVDDEIQNISDLQDNAVLCEQFQNFILNDDGYALEVILKEFEAMRIKYQAKLNSNPEYQDLVNSLDPQKINARYELLYQEIKELQWEKTQLIF